MKQAIDEVSHLLSDKGDVKIQNYMENSQHLAGLFNTDDIHLTIHIWDINKVPEMCVEHLLQSDNLDRSSGESQHQTTAVGEG